MAIPHRSPPSGANENTDAFARLAPCKSHAAATEAQHRFPLEPAANTAAAATSVVAARLADRRTAQPFEAAAVSAAAPGDGSEGAVGIGTDGRGVAGGTEGGDGGRGGGGNEEKVLGWGGNAREGGGAAEQAQATARRWSLDDFEVVRPLGRGKFGTVFMARDRESGREVALKVVSKREVQQEGLQQQVRREIEIHSRLRHQGVLRLYGYFYDQAHVYMVLELAPGGELYGRLRAKTRLQEGDAAKYVASVARALQYVHAWGVAHRDIKPENLLLSAKGEVKLADFGWSARVRDADACTTVCGTLDYLPPEMVEGEQHGREVDVWAVGVLLYEMLFGCPPFEAPTPSDTYHRILHVDLRFPLHVRVSESAKDLIRRLLARQPSQRLPLASLLLHPWVLRHTQGRRLVEGQGGDVRLGPRRVMSSSGSSSRRGVVC